MKRLEVLKAVERLMQKIGVGLDVGGCELTTLARNARLNDEVLPGRTRGVVEWFFYPQLIPSVFTSVCRDVYMCTRYTRPLV